MAIVYRVVAAIAYRDRPLVRVMAEEVPAAELRYVVPFEARSRYVGADYVEQLAKVRGGTFRRNPPDVGILASLDNLNGPSFDAGRVHPLIREFYEHTSRFKLSIVPEWRRWMKPGYELFKLLVAQPLGQAAIPSNIEEAQRGMISTIDTIALDGSEEIDIRGWIRTYADSGKPIYVGIYTSFRHEGRGYVSVGFPIPSANFTATLLPRNAGEHDFVLTSRTELAFPGHYLSSVDSERDALTVLKLLYFQEHIFVYVADGELKTDHSFYLAGQRFLTLHYEIDAFAAYMRGDIEEALVYIAPDGELYSAIIGGAEGNVYRGHDGFRRWHAETEAAFEELRTEFTEFRDLGDRVVGLGHVHARGRESGLELDSAIGWIFTLRDGRS